MSLRNNRPLTLFVLLLAFSFGLRLILSVQIYSGDLNNHFKWGESIIDVGASGAYDRYYPTVMQPTYPPLALYAFTTSSLVFRGIYASAWYLNSHIPIFPSRIIWLLQNQNVMPAFQKIIAIISDLGIGILIYTFIRQLKPQKPYFALLAAAFYLLNPAVWYVSSLWGQIDSYPLFFVILALYLVYRKRSLLSVLSFSAALLAKQSSVIFTPVFLIFYLSRFKWSDLVRPLAASLAFFYVVYLPFFSSLDLFWPFQVYLNRLQNGSGSDYVSDHAFNFWALFTHLQKISDSRIILFSLSYSQVGYILFALIIVPLLFVFARHSRPRQLFSLNTVISFASFLFLTRMHERYLVPVLPFMLLSAAYNPWILILYFLLSFCHLANIYHNWWFPNIPDLVNLLSVWGSIRLIILALLAVFLVFLINQYRSYEK